MSCVGTSSLRQKRRDGFSIRPLRSTRVTPVYERKVATRHSATPIAHSPSVNLPFPPVGWQSTCAHDEQTTTVWACENTVVMAKHPGHLTSMKNELGFWTNLLSLWERCCCSALGLRRSTARVCSERQQREHVSAKPFLTKLAATCRSSVSPGPSAPGLSAVFLRRHHIRQVIRLALPKSASIASSFERPPLTPSHRHSPLPVALTILTYSCGEGKRKSCQAALRSHEQGRAVDYVWPGRKARTRPAKGY